MATNSLNIGHGWVWTLSIFIFFFNTFLLPEGFTYTLLLTPVWLFFLHQQGKVNILLALLFPLVLYTVIHLTLGVNLGYYFISLTVIGALLSFLIFSNSIIRDTSINLDLIFRDIAVFNFILTLLCLPLLLFPTIKNIVWYVAPISHEIIFPRLKLFTEEASHYSFLLAPISIYFYSRVLFFKTSSSILTLIIVSLPLVLSFSLGVLASIFISACVILVLS